MKVYLVRHTSVDVPSGTCYGQTDVPLRASFEEEAAVCKAAIRRTGIDFTRVYASPLSRCTRLAGYCGFPDAERDDRLKEMHMGEWEMQRFDEITDPRIQEWYQDYLRVRTTGGESFMDVLARVSDFLDHLDRTSGPVLIFAHGGVLVAAQVYAGKVKLEDAMKALPPYGGMVEIDLPLPHLHPVMLAGTVTWGRVCWLRPCAVYSGRTDIIRLRSRHRIWRSIRMLRPKGWRLVGHRRCKPKRQAYLVIPI